MNSLRFPLALGVALAFGAAAAHAQSAPGGETLAQAAAQARILDIEVARNGEEISILVKLSDQPSAASAVSDNDQLKIEIDGIDLAALALSPPAGSLMTSVSAGKHEIIMRGAALSAPDVVVYRRAVLVKARMAEPVDLKGDSLMAGATPTPPRPATPPPAPANPHPALPAPSSAVETPPHEAEPLHVSTHAAAPVSTPAPVEPARHDQALHAAPVAPPEGPAAKLAGIDAARCMKAEDELATDAWALGAMGDHALCLIDAGKIDEARAKIDQLGAITPQDWRVSLGRALLADDAASANALFVAASLAAPNDQARAAIAARVRHQTIVTPAAEPELQLPLPK